MSWPTGARNAGRGRRRLAGAQKLEQLLALLDKATSLRHRGILWDMSPRGDERAVVLHTGEGEVARWTRDGEVLTFSATDARTADVQEASALTAAFLIRRLPKH